MIIVELLYSQDKLISLSIDGHASNLICAGVSSCFVGAMNAIKEIDKFTIDFHSGFGHLVMNEECSLHDKIVLETLVVQLYTIADAYKDECKIQVSRKEGKK